MYVICIYISTVDNNEGFVPVGKLTGSLTD